MLFLIDEAILELCAAAKSDSLIMAQAIRLDPEYAAASPGETPKARLGKIFRGHFQLPIKRSGLTLNMRQPTTEETLKFDWDTPMLSLIMTRRSGCDSLLQQRHCERQTGEIF